jgi:Ca-activated chloride channel family protein
MSKYARISLMICLLFFAFGIQVLADGIIIPIPPRPPTPTPPLRSLAIKYHHVTVTIQDQVVTTHVDQVFVNESGHDLEGEYLFPLPADASISRFALWVDGVPVEGRVLDRDEARDIYEDIVRQQRDPALLEYVGHNAFRAHIYPIPAHGERRVELEYEQVLQADQGLLRYTYPLSTEKFSTRPLEEVRVTVDIRSREALKAVYSPSHPIEVDKDDHTAQARYSDEQVIPDRDFVLYYTVGAEELGANLLSYQPDGEDGFFLLLLAPPATAETEELVARDVFFVLDTSGSMRGEKLQQAKAAARYVLDNLNPEDRFNIIAFSSSTSHYARGLQPASDVRGARQFIQELEAGGGTNIARALEETLAQTSDERPQVLVFLTDGLPTEGERDAGKIIARVSEIAGENVRLFTFGVGYDVNTMLLDALAQNHHGTGSYVRPEEDIESAVSSFYEKISKPVLADVALDFGRVQVEDVYPYPLPDLFAGGQLVVVGRYRQGGSAILTLSGTINDERVAYPFPNVRLQTEADSSQATDFIPRLWATRKIGYLMSQIQLHGAEDELIDEIIDLSVRYGIVTPYTSFLVDETEDALTTEGRRDLAERELAAPPVDADGRAGLAAAPASGEGAVEKSITQNMLRGADVVAQSDEERVRIVGDKTFVLRDGIWTDTTFDPARLEPERVALGGERYFALLDEHPEWRRYLALGPEVILVWEGQAYQIDPNAAPEPTPATPQPSAHTAPTPAGFWQQLQEWWANLKEGRISRFW